MRQIKGWIIRVAWRLSRLSSGGWFGRLFEKSIRWLPFRQLRQSDQLLIIAHPRPSYPFHVLLIPRRAIRGLEDIQADQADLLLEILQTAASIATEFGLQEYRIIVNGGAYQDVPQLHFHLISDRDPRVRG
jgi:diadenosine tetraphosphate (Ap4A) HIT family hydrolase